jgi:hypothetical protein
MRRIAVESGEWEFDTASLRGCEVSILVREEPKWDDPSQTVNKVAGYDMPRAGDVEVPGDTTGLGQNGASDTDDDIPF